MKKLSLALVPAFLVLSLFTTPLLHAADESDQDLNALERKVSEILKNQQEIIKRLDQVSEELRVLKIRIS